MNDDAVLDARRILASTVADLRAAARRLADEDTEFRAAYGDDPGDRLLAWVADAIDAVHRTADQIDRIAARRTRTP